MCESENSSPVKRILTALTGSGAVGAAKASPGVTVTGMTVMGYSIETWVSVLTALYLIFMLIGACPKMVEGLRYLFRLAVPRKKDPLAWNIREDKEVQEKMKRAKNEPD